MTANNSEAMELSLKNRKKAYGAMCKATILLFVFTFLSMAATKGIVYIMGEYSFILQKFLVRFVCLFGVDSNIALISVRNLLSSDAFYEVVQMFVSVFTTVIPAVIFAKCARLGSDECFNVRGHCIKGLFPMMGMCQMVTTFVLTFSSMVAAVVILPVFRADVAVQSAASNGFNPAEFVIAVLSNAVLVPVIEEYVFRGVVLSYLKRYGTAYAVVASALLFGIAHSSPEQSVFAFSFGLIAAFAAVVTGNIKTSIILHAYNNFVYVLEGYTIGTEANAIVRVLGLFMFGIGFAGIYYTLRKGGHFDVFCEKQSAVDKEAVILPGVRELLTVPVVVYLILYAVRFVSEKMM